MATTFYCWATLLIESHADVLVAGLVKRDLTISPLSREGRLVWTGEVGCLCGLLIRTARQFGKDESPEHWMLGQIKNVLAAHDAPYFSIILSSPHRQMASWEGPNIKAPSREALPASPRGETPAVMLTNPLDDVLDTGG